MRASSIYPARSIPVDRVIESLARGVAEAQLAVDLVAVRVAEAMAGGQQVTFDGQRVSLLELGFTPTFYQFVETVLEIKVSVSVTEERSTSQASTSSRKDSVTQVQRHGFLGLGGSTSKTTSHTTSVSAEFASRYQYSAEGSSFVRARLVPVPMPATFEERLHELAEEGG